MVEAQTQLQLAARGLEVEPIEQQDETPQATDAAEKVSLWPELFKTLMMALIIFLTARLFVLPYQVDGRSMAPNLENRDRVLVNRAVYMHLNLDLLIVWIPGVDTDDTDYYPFHSPERGGGAVRHGGTVSDGGPERGSARRIAQPPERHHWLRCPFRTDAR